MRAVRTTGIASLCLLAAACTRSTPDTTPPTTPPPASTIVDPTLPAPDPTIDAPNDALELSRRFGDATVKVAYDACGEVGHGSGFAIDDRHVVTNQHVVGPDPQPVVQTRDGRLIPTDVIGIDSPLDVAVLEAAPGSFATTVAWGDSTALEEGQPVVVIGYPTDTGDYDVLPISIRSIADDRSVIRVSTGIDAGNSGSATFADDGTVIGVARAVSISDYQTYGLLIPAELAAPQVAELLADPQRYRAPCDEPAPGETGGEYVGGSESVGTWIMQLGSVPVDADRAAIESELDRIADLAPGVRTLSSNDWPATFTTPDRIVYYVGGFTSRQDVRIACEVAGLIFPDQCLARLLR